MTTDLQFASWDAPASFEHFDDLKALHETALEGDVWFAKATALRDSSLIIYERWEATGCDLRGPRVNLDLHEIAIMLAGQALENLLKGSIVKLEAGTLTTSGIDFGPQMGAHDLGSLADRAQVPVDAGERQVLRYATEATLSFGRYPLPKSRRHMRATNGKVEPALRAMLTDTLFIRFAERLMRLNWPQAKPRADAAGPPWSTMSEDAYVSYRVHGVRPSE